MLSHNMPDHNMFSTINSLNSILTDQLTGHVFPLALCDHLLCGLPLGGAPYFLLILFVLLRLRVFPFVVRTALAGMDECLHLVMAPHKGVVYYCLEVGLQCLPSFLDELWTLVGFLPKLPEMRCGKWW
jgi:hypothetical protein